MEGSARQYAIQLRVQEHLSLKEIASRLKISKSTASLWLRDHPLTDRVVASRIKENGHKTGGWNRYNPGAPSKYQLMLVETPSSASRGNIAEAAIAFRLSVLGLPILTNMFNGGTSDFVVQVPSGRLAKLQVKWGKQGNHGRRSFRLTCTDGRNSERRYEDGELDFLIGYDLFVDEAHVFAWEELKHLKTSVSAGNKSHEAWHKLTAF